jgi:hypothetical protein
LAKVVTAQNIEIVKNIALGFLCIAMGLLMAIFTILITVDACGKTRDLENLNCVFTG